MEKVCFGSKNPLYSLIEDFLKNKPQNFFIAETFI